MEMMAWFARLLDVSLRACDYFVGGGGNEEECINLKHGRGPLGVTQWVAL